MESRAALIPPHFELFPWHRVSTGHGVLCLMQAAFSPLCCPRAHCTRRGIKIPFSPLPISSLLALHCLLRGQDASPSLSLLPLRPTMCPAPSSAPRASTGCLICSGSAYFLTLGSLYSKTH